jgi:hypothetical protein
MTMKLKNAWKQQQGVLDLVFMQMPPQKLVQEFEGSKRS